MAEYCAVPSCTYWQVWRTIPKVNIVIPKRVYFGKPRRLEHSFAAFDSAAKEVVFFSESHICYFASSRSLHVVRPISMSTRGLYGRDRDTLVCYCWGTFVDPDNAAPSNLVFAMDQLLLMFSALLAYSAGAIPSTWKNVHFKRDTIKEVSDSSSFTPYGRSELDENMPTSSTNDLWGEVNGKLVDALEAMASDSKLDNHLSGLENDCQRYALSIFALSHGPMWRLLQITLWRLEKEKTNRSLPKFGDEEIKTNNSRATLFL